MVLPKPFNPLIAKEPKASCAASGPRCLKLAGYIPNFLWATLGISDY